VTDILRPEFPADAAPLRERITAAWLRDETEHVAELLSVARLPTEESSIIERNAAGLVQRVRARATDQGVIEAFMREYDLSSEEGVLLMCVAEALLRIPDQATADKLIRDKLGEADWESHLGKSESVLVNASSWGLLLTGKMVGLSEATRRSIGGALKRLIGRAGEPVIRMAVRQAMRIMGHQFVMGRGIEDALARSHKGGNAAYRYSFDMLGEAAFTAADANRYFEAYRKAILAIGSSLTTVEGAAADVIAAPSISIKLSALHPRYEHGQRARVLAELTPRVLELAQLAKARAIGFTIDAEEADRLELSLDVILGAFADASLNGWNGYGLAVQAYLKRAPFVLDLLIDAARSAARRMPVRLVKGAYWDAEIKRAQVDGLSGYPVLTRKPNTDVSYLACAKKMLDAGEALYPMFATHNAHTLSAIHRIAQGRHYEYQKLHGMGDDLYAEVIGKDKLDVPCRVYAPVGSHEDLLPYLVRRLLENGANSSFINRITDESIPARELVIDPVAVVNGFACKAHPNIPLPIALYGADRINSMGINLADDHALQTLVDNIKAAVTSWRATPLVPGAASAGATTSVHNPADRNDSVGQWQAADAATIERALANAVKAQPDWDAIPAADRAAILERAATQMETRMPEFIALCMREAGKTISDSLAEVREAVDFLRYYAQQARRLLAQPDQLPGPTGESNQLQLHGRGVFACISPWNLPLAIFVGQIAAALVTGNTVLAKPAEQTSLIGYAAVKLLHAAGVPESVLQFLPGDGAVVGAALTSDPRVAGIAFTGSTATARTINRALAARDAAIAVLIAETGGQNAMIADSSALPEQLVKDAVTSAFGSAGQRCSAARVLFVQGDIAAKVIGMLAGVMDELMVGNPGDPGIDIGPVIDADALHALAAHAERMDREATLIKVVTLGAGTEHGTFFAPRAYELKSLEQLRGEVFGPILHVIRFNAADMDKVIDAINATGYGLTLGIHSRIDATVERIASRVKAGNCYVNRSMIGTVAGVQPFGGEGLSGTGPKAGGPNYLLRFVTERTLTVNTTAAGGNASLLTLGE
jgi:RHH-type proline utilization regulon transcriptional repressor/proline dehydrogenase/delta 1-pyrroline-5-carboxylate dehydrogenase